VSVLNGADKDIDALFRTKTRDDNGQEIISADPEK
jgi:hypothetical protein